MSTVYEIITDRIVGLLEQGTVPWRRPWAGGEQYAPRNGRTRHRYRGVNVFLLSAMGYESPYWLTFKQIKALGATIRKGERSTPVVFWKWLEKAADTDADDLEAAGSDSGKPAVKRFPMLRYYNVWSTDQCDGLPADRFALPDVPSYPVNPIESCERIVRDMPKRERFQQASGYYSVAFHELAHATGHEFRLNRRFGCRFGDSTYACEELVAEMGAAFLCGNAGIETQTIDNSAAYVRTWIDRLRGDSKLAVIAAAQAQKAVDFILDVDLGAERKVA